MRHSIYVVFALLLLAGPAGAFPISFGALSGANGDIFSLILEDSYTVTSTQGTWQEGHLSGNPTPSIFSSSVVSQIEVAGGPDFFLLSFETDDASIGVGTSTASYSVEGFLDGVSVLLGGGAVSPQYETNLSPDAGQLLDRLLITFARGSAFSYNIDNIEIEPIPEPYTALLLMAGLLGLVSYRRGRVRG